MFIIGNISKTIIIIQDKDKFYQMSNTFKIFGHQKQGFSLVQGRNAQVVMPKVRNSDSTENLQQNSNLSPFSGYQLSTPQTVLPEKSGQFSQESIRKFVKQQMDRNVKQDKYKSDQSIIRAEIRSIKEKIHELSSYQTQKQIEELKVAMADVLEAHRVQTTEKLREVVKKIDENIKKECSREYVHKQFIEQVEKQFNEFEDRLVVVEKKVLGNKLKPNQDPVVLSETIELRMKKNERQFDILKKTLSESQIKLKEQLIEREVKWEENELKKIKLQVEKMKKEQCQFQKQTKKSFLNVDHNKININEYKTFQSKLKKFQDQYTIKISELEKKQSSSEMDIKQLLHTSKNLAVSTMFEGSSLSSKKSSPQKKEQFSRYKEKQIKDLFISPKNQKVLSSPESKTKSPQSSADSRRKKELSEIRDEFQEKPNKQKEKLMYKIDDNSFLMDENGNYILNQSGQMIKLKEEHLNLLRESVLIKFEQT